MGVSKGWRTKLTGLLGQSITGGCKRVRKPGRSEANWGESKGLQFFAGMRPRIVNVKPITLSLSPQQRHLVPLALADKAVIHHLLTSKCGIK